MRRKQIGVLRLARPSQCRGNVDDASDLVCWCFGHTRRAIRADALEHGHSTIDRRVRARIAAGECDCERLNPRGRCCLGDIARVVREALAEGGS